MIRKLEDSSCNIIGFTLSGKLHDEDYNVFGSEIEAVVAREGKARLLAHFHDFRGWDLHAAWDDMKMAVKYYSTLERIAFVGERKFEDWMAKLCKPFTKAEVKYFDAADMDKAWAWLREKS